MSLTPHSDFIRSQQDCQQIIDKAERLTNEYNDFLSVYNIHIFEDWAILQNHPFVQARSILDSSLINVAVCGEFSSGKSFLISSLIGRLTWTSFRDDDGKEIDDHFTILPTGNTQTNGCPLEIRGYQQSDNQYRLEILFSGKDEYEMVSDSISNDIAINQLL